MSDRRRYLKVPEVADELQVTTRTVYNLIRRGQLRKTKVGRSTRITPRELERFTDRNTKVAKASAAAP